MITLRRKTGFTRHDLTSQILYLPNVLARASRTVPVEEVVFHRDEAANLVWAVERQAEGRLLQPPPPIEEPVTVGLAYRAGLEPPANWIPYLPRQVRGRVWFRALRYCARLVTTVLLKRPTTSVDRAFASVGDIFLQRARTRSDVDAGFDLIPQHRTAIIAASDHVDPGAIPSIPTIVAEQIAVVAWGTERWSFALVGANSYSASRPPIRRFVWSGRTVRSGTLPESLALEFDRVTHVRAGTP